MTLERVLRGAIFVGVFAIPFIPLIIAQSMFFPFITGKNFAFRIIVEVIFALWLALALIDPKYRPRRSWILYAFVLFVFLIGIADLLGENPLKSFWSNFERMEGWVTLAHLLGLLVVSVSLLNSEKLWNRLWHTSIGVSVLVGLYGIFQLLGWIIINQGGVRLDATFGNAIYLGIYMMFHMFLTALMWQRAWRSGSYHWSTGFVYGPILLLQASILFFTASRGAMLGVLGGAFLSAVLLVLFANHSKNAWRASVGVVAGIIVVSGGFFLIRDVAWVQNIEPLRRLAGISFTEKTISSRFLNIGMAVEGIKERPLLGWGQENYNYVFNKNYDPRMYAQEQWFDRTHNIVFDWLIAGGILGFIAYILIYIATLFALWRSGAFTIPERSILTGLLAAYAFSILFVFDNITSYLLFIFLIGYIAVRAGDAEGKTRWFHTYALPRRAGIPLSAAALVLAGLMVWSINWDAFVANRTLIQALQPYTEEEGGVGKNIEMFQKTLAYDTYGNQETREQLTQGILSLAGSSLSAEDKQMLLTLGADELKKQIEAAPDDARAPFFLGILYGSYGDQQKAREYLERALTLSPTKQTIIFQLAATELALGNADRAVELLKMAYELEPSFNEARIVYAALLIGVEQNAEADEIIQPLHELGVAADQRLINAYLAYGRYDKIIELWASTVRVFPQNVQARLALAASYHAVGNSQKSIEVLEQAAKDIPEIAPQTETYIQQIRDGTIQILQ